MGTGLHRVPNHKYSYANRDFMTDKTTQFIAKAKSVHGDRYDYSAVEYNGTHTPVTIICRIHGAFQQPPSTHASKKACGCPACGKDIARSVNTISVEAFIAKAKKVHGERYDYSRVTYVNNYTPVDIVCPKHGVFTQRPFNHIYDQYGCKECGNSSKGSASFLRTRHKRAVVYIVRMWNENEEFGKVGITTKQDAVDRFKSCVYNVEVLHQTEFDIDDAIALEKTLKERIQPAPYTPSQRFDGYTECFQLNNRIVDGLLMEYNK